MVVERQLAERRSRPPSRLGREDFIERSGNGRPNPAAHLKQLRRLGASCDWSRERFTLDEGLSRAVVKVFVNSIAKA